jgi:hypothetical protein
MKKLLTSAFVSLAVISASTAYAGGPVIVTEEPEVVAESPASGTILPLLLIGIALCVALCGSDDDDPVTTNTTPAPGPSPQPVSR